MRRKTTIIVNTICTMMLFLTSAFGGSVGPVGIYGAELPSASSPGRRILLSLGPDGRAEMSSDYLNDEPAIVEIGKWESAPDERVIINLTGRPDRQYDTPHVVAFVVQQDGLKAVDYDRAVWGAEGLYLAKQPDITGRVWQLAEIQYSDDTSLIPDDPAKYTLEFSEDGNAFVRADCNRGKGSYLLTGTKLVLKQPMAYTRALCPPGSIFDRYTKALDAAASCLVRDGKLYIAMKADSGILKFDSALTDQ